MMGGIDNNNIDNNIDNTDNIISSCGDMNISEAIIAKICLDIKNLNGIVMGGIEPSDLDCPYSDILAECISSNAPKSFGADYILLKYNISIDVNKYDLVNLDDIVCEINFRKKLNKLRSGITGLKFELDNLNLAGGNKSISVGDVNKVLDKVLRMYVSVDKIGKRDKVVDGNKVLLEVIDRIDSIKSGKIDSFRFGYSMLDISTGGICAGEILSIVGRPGSYKTTFMSLLLANAHFQNKRCLWINTEMRNESIMRKILAVRFNYNLNALKTGNISKQEEVNLQRMTFKNDFSNIIFASSFKMSVYDVVTLAVANKPDIVFVDSAYILRNEYKDRYDRISETIDTLKQLSLDLNCVVIFTHQLNREAIGRGKDRAKGGEYITLETIGFSDVVACNTDFVLSLYRTEMDKADKLLTVKPLKVRDGEIVDEFKIVWDFNASNFGSEKMFISKISDRHLVRQMNQVNEGESDSSDTDGNITDDDINF